ncbi:cyclic GMP-AMP synthase-like receptor isoform X2 [Anabrus simplex]|uniref:cyclic GMP-AMP synthase-like receptor isoform X2 n=1 Tax=Anabrus simplex TaxID=316456 RepID=UPI0035A2F6FC
MERHPNDYCCLVEPLKEITKSSISLRKDETKEYNMYLKEVIEDNMIPAMMEADLLFKCLYKRILHSGSYYENLKISKPNEFDLNVELEIPSNEIEILSTRNHGFVHVKVNQFDQNKLRVLSQSAAEGTEQSSSFYAHQLEDTLNHWLNEHRILQRNKVVSWMQGVVDSALNKLEIENIEIQRKNRKKRSGPGPGLGPRPRMSVPHPGSRYKITRSISGPAITLKVKYQISAREIRRFFIDLVPVFVFGKEHWPDPPVRQPVKIPEKATWCVVPIAPNSETLWRMSFYDQEKRMMTDSRAMKHTIKLLKLLRDRHSWACLSSYYIKTVFLWEKEVQDEQFWNKNVGYLFVHTHGGGGDYCFKRKYNWAAVLYITLISEKKWKGSDTSKNKGIGQRKIRRRA